MQKMTKVNTRDATGFAWHLKIAAYSNKKMSKG